MELDEIIQKIDIEKLRQIKIPDSELGAFANEQGSFTCYLLAARTNSVLCENTGNAMVIMRYEGGDRFVFIDEISQVDVDEEFRLPTGKGIGRYHGTEYLIIRYDGLQKIDIGLGDLNIPEEFMNNKARNTVIIAKAIVAWAMASNYIREHGKFIPLEKEIYGKNLSRAPQKILDLEQSEDQVRQQIRNYLLRAEE